MNTNKYIELAKKLKELAERGVGGEAVNARFMLDKLMAKHGITLDEIEDDLISEHPIKCDTKYERLLVQVCATVVGRSTVLRWLENKRVRYAVKCTAAQYIEIEAKAEFYIKAYKKELEQHFTAFIYANNLFGKSDENAQQKELTPEELAELRKALAMAENMDKHRYHKQLKA